MAAVTVTVTSCDLVENGCGMPYLQKPKKTFTSHIVLMAPFHLFTDQIEEIGDQGILDGSLGVQTVIAG
jgi:hypothetical protein